MCYNIIMNWLPPIKGLKKTGKAKALFFAFKDLILSGRLEEGDKLPPTREIAKYYSIDKSTVLEAIKLLKDYGLVETTQGSGIVISSVSQTLPTTSMIDNMEISEQREEISKEENLKYYFLMPDRNLFPYDILKKEMENIIEEEKEDLFEYKEPMGYYPLREWIANRLNTKPQNVMIVNGAQQALSTLCQLFLTNQSKVLLENPTYPGIIPLLKLYNADVSTIPIKQNGLCLSTLKHYLSSHFKFLYLQPSLQNPTGITLSENKRLEIIKFLPKHQVCVIEDSSDPISGKGKTMYELDPLKRVIHIGSFSKIFVPGFRIGWICGPEELIKKAVYLKALQDLQTPLFLQILIYRFLNSEEFPKYIIKMKNSLKSKTKFIIELFKKIFPKMKINMKELSYGIWFALPQGFTSKYVCEKLAEKNFKVADGNKFFYYRNQKQYIRIAHLNCQRDEIKNLFFELKEILKEVPCAKEYKITLTI